MRWRRNESEWMFSDNFRVVERNRMCADFSSCSAQTLRLDYMLRWKFHWIEMSDFRVFLLFSCVESSLVLSVQKFLFQLWKCCERRRWMLENSNFYFYDFLMVANCDVYSLLMFISILFLCKKSFYGLKIVFWNWMRRQEISMHLRRKREEGEICYVTKILIQNSINVYFMQVWIWSFPAQKFEWDFSENFLETSQKQTENRSVTLSLVFCVVV